MIGRSVQLFAQLEGNASPPRLMSLSGSMLRMNSACP